MSTTLWRAYADLAWLEPIISAPGDYAEETEFFVRAIREHARIETETLLHLGCGAGVNDFTFKRHFAVTGVDLSEDMLRLAGALNPQARYLSGDMRDVELAESFDAVAIPDSIGHMITAADLRSTIANATRHLKPGGVLLVVTSLQEEFQDNNFVYTGAREDVEVTIFENNYVVKPHRTTYEATVVYLIRREGALEIHSDRCTLGLFSLATWLSLFQEAGLEVAQERMDHCYDRFITGEGCYPLRVFVCCKP